MNIETSIPSLPELPPNTQQIMSVIENKDVPQGASRRIRQINDLFVETANGWDDPSCEKLIDTIMGTADYFIATRGRNTPAIRNAILQTITGLEELKASSVDEVRAFIRNRRDQNNTKSLQNVELIAQYGANLLENMKVVLPFDYSGTVMAILKQVRKGGDEQKLIVPESRSIAGGRPIVDEAVALGYPVKFIPDMVFPSYMHQVQIVLIGAETIFANGDCWNTAGCFTIAIIAKYFNVPFYVATDLLKIDPKSYFGSQREIKKSDFSKLFHYPDSFEYPEKVSVVANDLDRVPASLITGYITEKGVLPPHEIFNEAKKFLEEIDGFQPNHIKS